MDERAPLAGSVGPSYDVGSLQATTASPSTSPPLTGAKGGRVLRVGLDAAVLDHQKKWKQLSEISDDNSTAKDMASEVQSQFIHLREGVDGDELLLSTDADKFMIAAAFIRDGVHGRKIGYRLDRTALFLNALFHSDSYRLLYMLVVLITCLLAFAEQPGQQNQYLAVDLICMALFALDIWIRWVMSSDQTKRKFASRQPWAYARFLLLLVTTADLVLNLLFPWWNPYRYSRALRPFFLITRRRNIRIIFGSCLRALREVLIVLLLMFCLIGFFGLLGYLVFSDVNDAKFFDSLGSAMYTMLLIHNCMPYMVKAMYPYFLTTQWSAVYFVIFVLLTNLFLAKLTIAVSYRSYKQHTEKMLYKRLQKRKAALFAAFEILSEDVDFTGDQLSSPVMAPSLGSMNRRGSSRFFVGAVDKRTSFSHTATLITPIRKPHISLDTWVTVCEYLKPNWTSTEAGLVFNTIDIEHLGYLDLGDFYQLCSLLSVKLEHKRAVSAFTRFLCPTPRALQKVKRWKQRTREILLYETVIFGKYPVVIAELVVGALICLSVVQAVQVNNIELAFSVNRSWRILGIVLLCLFTLEVQLKLFAFGRAEFFQRPFCKLDLAIVAVGWFFYLVTSNKNAPDVSLVFYDMALAVRSLRILKLLNLFPPFHEILWTMKRIMPLMLQLIMVILSVMYAFAIFTQANYGILLRDYPAEKQALSPQWYAVRQEFQVDTFAETLVTLFGVANLAGWDMIMDAAHATTGSDSTYVFFFAYRITMSNILLPIFVGFIVESFVSNAKNVEETIETYVEAVPNHSDYEEEDQRMALLESKGINMSSSRSPGSCSSDGELRFKFERRGSLVHNQMFDAVQLSNASRLKLLVEKKDEEIAQQDAEIRKLESNMLGMQSRLNQSQRVILAYEAKLEEVSTALRDAQIQQQTPTRAGPSRRKSSWRVWRV